MSLTIKTNNVPRDVLRWHELTAREQAEFDYLDTEDRQADASFFRYKGQAYDLGEYMRISDPMFGLDREGANEQPAFRPWDGYASDSYFSGTLVRYVQDFERVIVATYYGLTLPETLMRLFVTMSAANRWAILMYRRGFNVTMTKELSPSRMGSSIYTVYID